MSSEQPDGVSKPILASATPDDMARMRRIYTDRPNNLADVLVRKSIPMSREEPDTFVSPRTAQNDACVTTLDSYQFDARE